MIESLFTSTAEGMIPHLEVCLEVGIVRAPVKLITFNGGKRPEPKRTNMGAYVYALPGGEEYVP